MMVLLCLFALWSEATVYKAEELAVGRLMSFAGNGPYAFAHFMGRSPGNFEMVIFDLKKREARKISDGRLNLIRSRALTFSNGFVLIDAGSKTAPKCHFLDPVTGYQRTDRLSDYENWQPHYMFAEIGYDDDGQPLIIYNKTHNPLQVGVASLDFEKRQILVKDQILVEGPSMKLTVLAGQIIRMDQKHAEIVALTKAGKQHGPVIFPAREPIVLSSGFLGRKNDFRNVIYGVHAGPQILQLRFADYYDDKLEPTKTAIHRVLVLDSTKRISEQDFLTIHRFEGIELVYNLELKSFVFSKD